MCRMNRVLPFFLLILVCWGVAPVQAQRVQIRSRARQTTPAGIDSTLVARFQLADTYLRGAQYDRAIVLLEDLYTASPKTFVFYEKLKEAYENLKRYDDAIVLVNDWMQRNQASDPTSLLAEKARLYYLKGEEQTAFTLWDDALAQSSANQNAYRIVYSKMIQVRLLDRAITVLEQGRGAVDDASLFQAELAYLYSLTGQHENAMEEYLGLLATNERQLNYVRSWMSMTLV